MGANQDNFYQDRNHVTPQIDQQPSLFKGDKAWLAPADELGEIPMTFHQEDWATRISARLKGTGTQARQGAPI